MRADAPEWHYPQYRRLKPKLPDYFSEHRKLNVRRYLLRIIAYLLNISLFNAFFGVSRLNVGLNGNIHLV